MAAGAVGSVGDAGAEVMDTMAAEVEHVDGASADDDGTRTSWLGWMLGAIGLVLLLALLVSQCGEASTLIEEQPETESSQEVRDLGAEVAAAVSGLAGVGSSVSGDVATLTGTVAGQAESDAAEAAALAIDGINSVDNQLQIEGAAGMSSADFAALSGVQGVTVSIEGGVATLTGTVGSQADSDAAEAAALTIPGVTSVNNQLTVESDPGADLTAAVSGIAGVTASLNVGVATLEGTVGSSADRDAAEAAAAAVAGVDSVDNQLFVDNPEELESGLGEYFALNPITFESGSAVITADGQTVLEGSLAFIQNQPSAQISIEGHTDSQGGAAGNQTLSEARAQAVLDWLVNAGVEADRLSSAGFGEDQPIADNGTAEGRAENRRIEFKVS